MSGNRNGGVATPVDPIVRDIISGAVDSTCEEMNNVVRRMARSSVIREQCDFRSMIYDRDGNLVAHVLIIAFIDPVLRKYPKETMKEGDLFLYNDPYLSEGGIGHLPDMCVVMPVFYKGEIVAFTQTYGHTRDVGGIMPGGFPTSATSVFQEGIQVPPIRIYDGGKLNNEAYDIILRNTRLPEELRGDLDAFMVACRTAGRRIVELCDRYGADIVDSAFKAVIRQCADTIREKIFPKIPLGKKWVFDDFVEDDGVERGKHHKIKLTVSRNEEKIIIDFTGSAPQAKGPINWVGDAHGGRYYKNWCSGYLKAFLPELRTNAGAFDVIECIVPKPSMFAPVRPAPGNARSMTMIRLTSTFMGVLAKMSGGQVAADSSNVQIYDFFYTDDSTGETVIMGEILGAGGGGRPFADGTDAIDLMPDSKNLPAEFVEQRYPCVVESIGLYRDSGGPGKYRGGLGYRKSYVFTHDGELSAEHERTILSPWGLMGGGAGKPGYLLLNKGRDGEKILVGNHDAQPIMAGDTLEIVSPGGGGWGDPLEREPRLVRLDCMQGKVSLEGARRDYGVVIESTTCDEFGVVEDPGSWNIDMKATEELRMKMRCERPPLRMFDRGEYADRAAKEGKIEICGNPMIDEAPRVMAEGG